MKDKILFFLLGAAVMYALNHFLPSMYKNDEPITVARQQEIEPVIDKISTAPAAQAEKIVSDEEPKELNASAKSHSAQSRDLSKQNSMMRAFRLQKLKPTFAKFLGHDTSKLEQASELADKKMARDQELTGLIRVDFDDAITQGEQQLMFKDDSELAPEQLLVKQSRLKKGEEYAALTEQNRVEFEDELKNLLSSNELDAFRQQEREAAQKDFERYVGNFDKNSKISIDGLNSFQTSQLDKLFSSYARKTLGDIPIGSTVSANPISVPPTGHELIGELYKDLEPILSQEQLDQFKSRPIMFDFSQ